MPAAVLINKNGQRKTQLFDSVGGLSKNDFICAARNDNLTTK
jgi:pterin-4a-carbinolamine dehydratase